MPSEKLTDLTPISNIADNDLFYVVPVAGGTQNQATRLQIVTGGKVYSCPSGAAVGSTVYINGVDSVALANATTSATMPCIGLVSAKITSTTCTIAGSGSVITGFIGLTTGATYYVDIVDGGITTIIPTAFGNMQQIVGYAIDTTSLLVNIGMATLASNYGNDLFFFDQNQAAYVDLGDFPEATFTGDFTFGMWFKLNTNLATNGSVGLYNRLFNKVSGGNGYEVYINKDVPSLSITIQINGSNRAVTGGASYQDYPYFPMGVWNYAVLQNSGGTYAFYLNGGNVITLQNLGNPADSTGAHLFVGNSGSFNAGWWGGANDVQLYNRALTVAEIQALPSIQPANLVQRWLLNEGTGTTVHDIGPHTRTGTTTNCTWDNLNPAPYYLSPLII